jgi:threonine/homoserine/homoserine lactone efflux protein
MVSLSGVFMPVTVVVFAGYGALAAAVRDRLIARPRVMTWMRRVFAGSFVGLSIRLALASR